MSPLLLQQRDRRLAGIVDCLAAHGPQTVRELGARIGIDHTALHRDLRNLELARRVKPTPNPNWRRSRDQAKIAKHRWEASP